MLSVVVFFVWFLIGGFGTEPVVEYIGPRFEHGAVLILAVCWALYITAPWKGPTLWRLYGARRA